MFAVYLCPISWKEELLQSAKKRSREDVDDEVGGWRDVDDELDGWRDDLDKSF